jgi:F-type H+-transporting ATPase subunit gamma
VADLKTLRNRIKSVKSTQKITKAMKMVAAAKLRRAQEAAEAARPYAERMERMLGALANSIKTLETAPALLSGRYENGIQKDGVHLLLVLSSDRGLCGGFNGSIVKAARQEIRIRQAQGKQVKVITFGKKAYELLKNHVGKNIVERVDGLGRKPLAYSDAETLAKNLLARFDLHEFDSATVIYNAFRSAISQVVTIQQLIPLDLSASNIPPSEAVYDFEPEEDAILEQLLPQNVAVQIYHALLENAASEQGARMAAMDNATRNAGEMIKKLTLVYNRSRQATITKELIEIISGAEAV